ncbi:hypothetical protein [Thioalkalivibrio sp. ALE20]|uniref:hypothetical protein n=1 Tax=Thioalkalivibrio sp. ALE20 TaxID=545275 RepID=UPI000371AE50|nr:hypothetical protein [Thioalkalivibrio sp. ALE20]
MQILAEFAMKSRGRAVGAVAGFGIAGLFLPPVSIVSSALVALVGLRLGLGQALIVLAIASALLGAALWGASPGTPGPAVLLAGVIQWLPVALLAELLRRTVSWRITLKAGALVAGAGVLLMHALVPDPEAFWVRAGLELLQPLLETDEAAAREELEAVLADLAPYLAGLLAGIVLLSVTLAMLIARYWQAALYNPGAFGAEFRALQLGPGVSAAAVVLLAVGQLVPSPLAMELAFILGVLFFLQGIALMHALTHGQGMSVFWLVGMYVLMALALPQMFLLLATIGVIDAWADIRRRMGIGRERDAGDDPPES